MRNKKLKQKRIISFLIILIALALIAFGLNQIIDILTTPLESLKFYHGVLLILITRAAFWERKWKW